MNVCGCQAVSCASYILSVSVCVRVFSDSAVSCESCVSEVRPGPITVAVITTRRKTQVFEAKYCVL